MSYDDRLIIEVSSRGYQDYRILKDKMSNSIEDEKITALFTNGVTVLYNLNMNKCEIDSYNFILIRDDFENEDFTQTFEGIVNLTGKSKIAIAVHKGQYQYMMSTIVESFKNLKQNNPAKTFYDPVEFSHIDDSTIEPVWNEGIKPLVNGIQNNFNNYEQLYNRLWDLLARPDRIARWLMYKFLSPLVALDLITQVEGDGDYKTKIKKEIKKELDYNLQKYEDKDLIDRLCEFLAFNDKEKKKLRELIVNSNENQTISHHELKKIADELEIKISEIANN